MNYYTHTLQEITAAYNQAVKDFRKNPSASNYRKLEQAMLVYQDAIKNHTEA